MNPSYSGGLSTNSPSSHFYMLLLKFLILVRNNYHPFSCPSPNPKSPSRSPHLPYPIFPHSYSLCSIINSWCICLHPFCHCSHHILPTVLNVLFTVLSSLILPVSNPSSNISWEWSFENKYVSSLLKICHWLLIIFREKNQTNNNSLAWHTSLFTLWPLPTWSTRFSITAL